MESPHLSVSAMPLFLSAFILLLHRLGTVSFALASCYTGDIIVNCGSKWNSTALDGREWVGESASVALSGQSTSSVVVAKSSLSVDPVPYLTSRISAYPFHFTFQVNPGQKFIRFHFYPALYRGFEKSFGLFTVKAGVFILLNHFSPTLVSSRLGVKYIVKEFCLNVEEHGELRITFSPSTSWEFNNQVAHAFVNGIEVISMPTGLYYTLDGHLGVPIVGQNYRFHAVDNSSALELVQRLNIGGNLISSVEDFGLFRRWTADAGYFLESGVPLLNYMAPKVAYTNLSKVYQTSWKTTKEEHQLYSFTWKIPVNVGFGYLVRLHFCDLDAATTGDYPREFSILINNQIVEMHADVIKWSGGTGYPVYKDFVVVIKEDKEGSECSLFINLQSLNGLSLGLLKGLEIFRLSNPDNCLATSSPASLKKVSATWNLNVQKLFSLFSQSSAIGTGMTTIILIVPTLVYYLRIIWEENAQNENDEESATVEPSTRRFSLADIRSATQNFSDAFVIGKGGFGKVYKGRLSGFPEIVAIKRLSLFSRQGAHEFWTEIETLSKLRHFNLVPLIGYCNEDEEMILIYEYIPGGTLAENLYKFARKGKDCALLSWEQRLRICIGAARGLEYLHTGSETGIIHRDVKDTNILLGDNFIPKIADFGLSKLEELTQSKSYVSTRIVGTIGYLDPYYCATRRLTRKSDVYSFGIVMLVVLSGRPAIDTSNPGEPESLLVCFQECLSGEEFNRIVDPKIFKNIEPGSLKEFVESVESCLQQKPKNRPTMAQLVGSLEQALQIQEKPIASASGDSTVEVQPFVHFELETIQSFEMSQGPAATLEESVVSAPMDKPTRKKTSSRGEVPNRIRRPFWGWPWKLAQSRKTITDPTPSSRDFKSASESDSVWETFLPSDYQEIISKSVGPPINYATKRDLYFSLCNSPIIINDGKLSFWLSKSSGKKCYMLSAKELSICWKDTPDYWIWNPMPESRFAEVGELKSVCWLDIEGKMSTQMLSLKTTYAAYLVFRITEDSMGLDRVAMASVRFSEDAADHHDSSSVSLVPKAPSDRWRWHPRSGQQQSIVARLPKQRRDGWMEIFLGEFFNEESDRGDIQMKLWETKNLNWKSGLILEGIELRPKEDAI